jgi:hypothetical protein
MTATPNLNMTEVEAAQNQKEVTINAALRRIDAAFADTLAVSVSADNATPTAEQVRAATRLLISGASTSGRTVTLPIMKARKTLHLAAASTKAVSIVRGSTAFLLYPGCKADIYTDGTSNGLERLSEYGPVRTRHWVRGVLDNSEVIFSIRFDEPHVLLPDALGWDIRGGVAATGSTVLDLRKNGSGCGTGTVAASGTQATMATTGNAAVAFAAGDLFDLRGPATADATFADINISAFFVRS